MNPRSASQPISEPASPELLARQLYEKHGPAIHGWVQARFGDRQTAEEVVQEVVLAAWRKYDQFDPSRGTERSWMFGIARNVAATRHRRDKRHLAVVTNEMPDTVKASSGEDHAERVAEQSLVADAVRGLRDDHRAVITAAYWEGLSTKEIAGRLDIPDGTVKSRLHYAMRALRSGLEEEGVL